MNIIDYKIKFKEVDNRFTIKNKNTKDLFKAEKMFFKLREWIWYGKRQIK